MNGDIIFQHIPRTGGGSVGDVIVELDLQIIIHMHNTRVEFEHVREFVSEPDFVFTFIRNPYERVVSSYFYLLQGGTTEGDKNDRSKYLRPFNNFSDFVLNGLNKASKEQIHFRPQRFWIEDNDGSLIPDYIGKTKNLSEDLRRVLNKLGFKEDFDERCINSSDHKEWNSYYDSFKVIEKVREVYFEDVKLYKNILMERLSE